MKVSMD